MLYEMREFLGGSGNAILEWEGNVNEIQQSWEWELEWELEWEWDW